MRLDLPNRHLTSLYHLSYMVTMETIDLSNNSLVTLPKDIRTLHGVRSLSLDNNKVEVLPCELALETLEELSLHNNSMYL